MQDALTDEAVENDGGFRAQLPLPELQRLFDYWLSRHREGHLPRRADIDPIHIPALLPGICLMEIDRPSLAVRVRLAGTRLREGYGTEMTGRALEDVMSGEELRYWQAVAHRVAIQRKPAHGITCVETEGRPDYYQVWLRLPLEGEDGEVAMMVGYDAFLMSKKAGALIKNPRDVARIA